MRKIFIILCCGLLLLTCGCGKKDEVSPAVNTVKSISEIIKTEEEKPPTESQPTETSSAETTTTTDFEDFEELTAEILRTFILKIVVHERAVKWSKDCEQEIDIYFNYVGNLAVDTAKQAV